MATNLHKSYYRVASRRKKKMKRILIPYLFLLPGAVLLFTFQYLPTLTAFYYSFTEYHILAPAKWIGLQNYKSLLSDNLFWQSLYNSFRYLIVTLPFFLVVPLILAILINQKIRGINFFRVIYYLPVITPGVAVAIVWLYLYHPQGPINAFFLQLGILQKPVNWLLNTSTALPAVSALEIWKRVGFYMIIYLAGLQVVPKDLIDSAKIDGANAFRVVWHVYLPQIRPIIAVVLVLGTLDAVKIFTSAYIMTGGGPMNSTESLSMYIYQTAFEKMDMGYATAMGMVFWAILMFLTILNFKLSRGENPMR